MSLPRPLAWTYAGLGLLAGPFLPAVLRARARRGKEDPDRLDERLGHASRERPRGPLVWLHAASVGESVSLLPLVEALQAVRPGLGILMTTGTVTSAKLMAQRLPPFAIHQYFPLDAPAPVDRFLHHWHPELAVFCESELWPGWLGALAHRRIPAALVNARMSPRSFDRWRRVPKVASALLGGFAAILAQSEEDAARLRALGAAEVTTPGNLKDAAAPLPVDTAELVAWRKAARNRPVWLAASTHPGEDEVVLDAHAIMAAERPDLLTVIVPRHPDRGASILALAQTRGHRAARRSLDPLPAPDDAVNVADTLGELGLFYRACGIVLVGGSLIRHGGQNPLEPARLGCTILTGPHTWNFNDSIARLRAAGALREVIDADQLASAVTTLLDDEPACRDLGERAILAVRSADEVVLRTLDTLLALLDRRAAPA